MKRRWLYLCAILLQPGAILAPAQAATPPGYQPPSLADILPLLDASSPDALEGVLRTALIQHLPEPLYEGDRNWGRQRKVPNQVKWRRHGIVLRPEVHYGMRNDGIWEKYRLESRNLRDTLVLDIRDVSFPEPTRMQFGLFLSFDARAEYYRHVWESGVRLYAGSVKARFRAKLLLGCEVTARLEPQPDSVLPDMVFRARVASAKLGYDNIFYEHVPGLGGSAAAVLGKAFHNVLEEWHPALEQGLLERGNAAIVRAGDTKEVRVSLGRIFRKAMENAAGG